MRLAQVHSVSGMRSFECETLLSGVAPKLEQPQIPAADHIESMRTPPLEVVLGEYRARKGLVSAPPHAIADAAAQPPAPEEAGSEAPPLETPRSGLPSFPYLQGWLAVVIIVIH